MTIDGIRATALTYWRKLWKNKQPYQFATWLNKPSQPILEALQWLGQNTQEKQPEMRKTLKFRHPNNTICYQTNFDHLYSPPKPSKTSWKSIYLPYTLYPCITTTEHYWSWEGLQLLLVSVIYLMICWIFLAIINNQKAHVVDWSIGLK